MVNLAACGLVAERTIGIWQARGIEASEASWQPRMHIVRECVLTSCNALQDIQCWELGWRHNRFLG